MWAIYEKDKNDLEVYGEMCAPHKPFSVQLCINWGCNRQATVKNTTFDQDGLPHCKGACDFCGAACLADPETGAWEHKRMDVEVAAELARQMHAWKPNGTRYEIDKFGEPWLNKKWPSIVKALRDNDPKCSINLQTNGIGVHKKDQSVFNRVCDQFFEAGGNMLVFDAYEGSYSAFVEKAKAYCAERDVLFVDFIYDNANHHNYYRKASPKTRELYVVDDLGECNINNHASNGHTQRHINNHAGLQMAAAQVKYGTQVTEPLSSTCTRVFREIIVGYDGTVTVCCHEFARRLNLGNILQDNVRDIWNGRDFRTVRALLKNHSRSWCNVCADCSYWGGNLAHLERISYEPTDEDMEHLADTNERLSNSRHPRFSLDLNYHGKQYRLE